MGTIILPHMKHLSGATLRRSALKNAKTLLSTHLKVGVDIKASYGSEATFELKPYKLHCLESGPASSTKLDSAEALVIYQKMTLMRKMEAACSTLYKEKLIRGFCHLYTGQEAVAAGMHQVLRPVDDVITSYRCHTWTHLMGASLVGVIGELVGRKCGASRGKGGSMHMYAKNFYGGNGIVGAQCPLGAGLALAHYLKNDGGIAYTLYGDGAANQGQLFEVYNISKLWNLPCVFVCENNQFAMGTSNKRAAATEDYYMRGCYIPGLWVDGMDVLTVREATRFITEYVTSGNGPLVVEMNTYRYFGHSMSDPGTSYRSRDEVQEVRKTRDAIKTFKDAILGAKLVTEDDLSKIDAEVKGLIKKAVDEVVADTELGKEEFASDMYAVSKEPAVRGVVPDLLYESRNAQAFKNT